MTERGRVIEARRYLQTMIDERCVDNPHELIGEAVREFVGDREDQARAAARYMNEPTIETREDFRTAVSATEMSRAVLSDRSKRLSKDVANSLWSAVRTFERGVDAKAVEQSRRQPQLGDPGYAEYREQQRGKDRDGRER